MKQKDYKKLITSWMNAYGEDFFFDGPDFPTEVENLIKEKLKTMFAKKFKAINEEVPDDLYDIMEEAQSEEFYAESTLNRKFTETFVEGLFETQYDLLTRLENDITPEKDGYQYGGDIEMMKVINKLKG